MRKIIAFHILSVFFISCGNEQPETSNASTETAEIQDSIATNLLNTSCADSLLTSYVRNRKNYLASSSEYANEEYNIYGNIYLETKTHFIVNITEEWGNYTYNFAFVMNFQSTQESNLEQADGMYTDIAQYIKENMASNYTVLLGYFEPSPAYELGISEPHILTERSGYRTSIQSLSTLYLIEDEKLLVTNASASTQGEAGEYPSIDGFQERFIINEFKSEITIEVEENQYTDNQLDHSFKYTKMWYGSDEVLDDNHKPVYLFDYVDKEYYSFLPKSDYAAMSITNDDTLLDYSGFELAETTISGDPQGLSVNVRGMSDGVSYYVMNMKKNAEGDFVLICLGEIDRQFSSGELFYFTISPIKSEPELFYFFSGDEFDPGIYCSNLDRFEFITFEGDY